MSLRWRYLGLDADLDEAADDGEGVADDEEEVPAVDELHPVSKAHPADQSVFEELHVLLERKRMKEDEDHIKVNQSTCVILGESVFVTVSLF